MKFIRMSDDGKSGIFEIEPGDGVLMVESEDGDLVYAAPDLLNSSAKSVDAILNKVKSNK